MNIGIITQPLINNYGGTLQNYALQIVLQKLGHNPVTCNYLPAKSWLRVIISLLITPILYFTNRRRTFKSCFPVRRDKYISKFLKENVNITKQVSSYTDLLIKEYNLEGFVVGSDQVWRPIYNEGVLYDNFLAFAKGYNVKRIAYAASFGVDTWEYSESLTQTCSLLAKNFDSISVREDSGVKLCFDNLQVSAVKVLDPTLLLSEEDYNQIAVMPEKINGRYVLSYILNESSEKKQFIQGMLSNTGLNNINISINNTLQYSIPEWLGLFKNAERVVTDSFHGTVFSILYKKDFYVLANKKRGTSRLKSLLNSLGLSERYLEGCKGNETKQTLNPINWYSVLQKLELYKRESWSFLENSLNK